jgi:hypothetical protein
VTCAQPQFHLARCRVRKGDRHDAGEFRSSGYAADNLLDELSRLAGSRGGFKEEAGVNAS